MNISIIVLIGTKVQCDLYPIMFSLLADVSGIIVHIVEIADAITPAIKTNKTNSFIISIITFFII